MLRLETFPPLPKHPSLDDGMLRDHLALYGRYTETYNTLVERLARTTQSSMDRANPIYSGVREQLVEQQFARNAALLHIAYFQQLVGDGDSRKATRLTKALTEQFPTWKGLLRAAALASRGWAFLTWCPYCVVDGQRGKGTFHVSIGDDHSKAPFDAVPLIVLDVYEHAYMPQYGLDRAAYLDALDASMEWAAVEARYIAAKDATPAL